MELDKNKQIFLSLRNFTTWEKYLKNAYKKKLISKMNSKQRFSPFLLLGLWMVKLLVFGVIDGIYLQVAHTYNMAAE